jgi:hypothetical protein
MKNYVIQLSNGKVYKTLSKSVESAINCALVIEKAGTKVEKVIEL